MVARLGTIARDLGRMLQALAAMVFVSILVPVVWGEYYTIPALVLTGLIPLGIGWFLSTHYADAPEPGKLHGMMIAASGWFFVALFGSLPFLFVAWTVALSPPFLAVPAAAHTGTLAAFRNPLNGVFESMSGFTGTGLTMAVHENVLPRALQWWRSFIEWV
ncbi:MAG: TrkH family potassium uptake protein, partial [Salinigranum sp.]